MGMNIDEYFQGQLKQATYAPAFPTNFRVVWTYLKILGKDESVRVSSCLN